MRRSRPEESARVHTVSLLDLDDWKPKRTAVIRRHRKPILLTTASAATVAGLVLQPWYTVLALGGGSVLWLVGVMFGGSELIAPEPTTISRPRRIDDRPVLTVVFRAEPTEADPRLMSVEATLAGSANPWYSGGGLHLSANGLITAADGRGREKTWKCQTGGVHGDQLAAVPLYRNRGTGPARPAESGPTRVVEIAAVGDEWSVHFLYLRNERGQQLAALPAAGLDGQRIAAFARAAGVHYRRFDIAGGADAFGSSGSADCFPPGPGFVRFDGPDLPVPQRIWTRDEGV